jgi:glycosyltransferase involved in cell wall biosynthesis
VKGEEPPDSDWIKWYREIVCEGLAGADEVITPSHWMMDNVNRYYLRPACARVVHNGCNPALFDATEEKHDQVVSVGRIWDEAKQVSLLLKRSQAVPVAIVGSQEHPDKTLSPFAAEHVPNGVTLCGQQSEYEIRQLFARSSIYAACSCYEPFGLAPVEAAMSACAIVANDIATFRELWGDSAYYFDKNNAESLSAAISVLSNDEMLRKEYSQRGYHHAIETFNSEKMVNSYESAYQRFVRQEAAA